ncbi:lantibiotic dehydratase [Nocardiopsis sp. JB363]|uniref:lantibiotic dehydratase n=1 Tax=Nocardiopsis sp. JB363 TaxID=1434837 RepID=UPI00097A66CB|nr:lantibiotic dehydratase [Nocardiopsis sp. JB363]SIO89552.1 Lanthionine biosynthesis protein LanB [Nocardiopsis sp. JB363]
MAPRADRTLYHRAGPPLIRATTYPRDLRLPDAPDLSGAPEDAVEQGNRWLRHVWRDERLRGAVQHASPVLFEQVGRVVAGHTMDARRIRRLVRSLGSYVLRWRGRATPFGLFAGVAEVKAGTQTRVRWGDGHRTIARAGADWLERAVDRLEQQPRLLHLLPVIANATAFVRDDRLVIPGLPSSQRPREIAPQEVSIRHTPPVRAAMAAAQVPLLFRELLDALVAEYPNVPREQTRFLLAALVAQNFLITSLRAPMSEPDALAYLCTHLDKYGAEELPETADIVSELRETHRGLECHRQSPSEVGSVVDTVLDAGITLPENVFREAEAAAAALIRLSPYPYGYPRWKDFHSRFRERYGPGAVIPVVEVVSDAGLGLPADYLGSAHTSARPALTERDRYLLALAQEAALSGRTEVVLTDSMVDEIALGEPQEVLAPSRVELAFQLHAPSAGAVDRGDFRLLVTSAPRPGSSMAGRFAHLLSASARSGLAESYTFPAEPGTVTAQLSFPPRQRRTANAVRTSRLLPVIIPLAEHHVPGGDVIGLHDLALTADARHLRLLQLSTGRYVEPRVTHALEAAVLTPALARFLAEAPTGRCAVYQAFDWGAASSLPFLPRLRRGRTVLAAARWRLSTDSLPGPGAPNSAWVKALSTWRERLGAPTEVVMCSAEMRLPLNLDRPLDREVLRARLERTSTVELREGPSPDSNGWLGRAHEILVPFHHTAADPPLKTERPSTPVTPSEQGKLPGFSDVVHAQIHGHPARQDTILLRHLPDLVNEWPELHYWWFERHHDLTHPDRDQHLALYFRLRSERGYGDAVTRIGAWAATLRSHGLVPHFQLATYHPQTGRYGHGTAMSAAERLFAADSAAALAQAAYTAQAGTPGEVVTVAGMYDLATSYTPNAREAVEWLVDHLPHEAPKLDRVVRDQALHLADPDKSREALQALPTGQEVLRAWQHRRTALSDYRARLASQRDPEPVLRSLLHLHHTRALGADPQREQLTHHLVRAAAQRDLARKTTR